MILIVNIYFSSRFLSIPTTSNKAAKIVNNTAKIAQSRIVLISPLLPKIDDTINIITAANINDQNSEIIYFNVTTP